LDFGNMVDEDMCTNACKSPKCGDSIKQANEECDDGNMVDNDMCTNACKSPKCGDGIKQANEECDDGNMVNNDSCSNTCKSNSKIVFVSSQMYTGNMGGLAGADMKCQTLAQAAGLPGTYMAWLSDATGSPSTRMTQSAVPYVLPNGTKIANNWADLIDGNLIAGINLTETNGAPPIGNTSCAGGGFPTVWTDTNTNGTLVAQGSSCSNWSSTNGGSYWGQANQTTGIWTAWCSGGLCSWQSPIYCFQQ
jgi:cysteine-rich repeat protein